MKPETLLSFSELYALEREARLVRAQEVARLIGAGVAALGRFAGSVVAAPKHRKDACHA